MRRNRRENKGDSVRHRRADGSTSVMYMKNTGPNEVAQGLRNRRTRTRHNRNRYGTNGAILELDERHRKSAPNYFPINEALTLEELLALSKIDRYGLE